MRRHDCVFHRARTHEQLREAGLAILAVEHNRATRLAKVGVDEERVESLLRKRHSKIGAAECLTLTWHRASEKKGAGVFIETVHRERRSKRSKRLCHNAGALFVGYQNTGSSRKTQLGDGSNDTHTGELLHLIDRLDARIQHEKRDGEANTGSQTTQETLHPSFRCAGPNRRSAHSWLMNTHRGLRELLGNIHFLQSRKNRVIKRLIGLLLALDVIILDRFGSDLQKSSLSFLASDFCFICLDFESVAGRFKKVDGIIENAPEVGLGEVNLGFDGDISGVLCTIALGEEGQLALAGVEGL